jgi:nitrilase
MRIAAGQAHPVWLDAQATAAKVVAMMEKAAAEGVGLIAFPETFLPGYPFWAILGGVERLTERRDKEAYAFYLEAAVDVAGPPVQTVREAAGDLGLFVYLGIAERAAGSVFATLLAIDSGKGVVSAHRKLMPTQGERTVWATGDGHGLRVHDAGGFRVGGLNC